MLCRSLAVLSTSPSRLAQGGHDSRPAICLQPSLSAFVSSEFPAHSRRRRDCARKTTRIITSSSWLQSWLRCPGWSIGAAATACRNGAYIITGYRSHRRPIDKFNTRRSRDRSGLRQEQTGGRIGPVVSSSSSRPGLVAVCSYRGCRAGRARPSVERHSVRRTTGLTFGCINIRSLGNKLDDLLDVRRDYGIK